MPKIYLSPSTQEFNLYANRGDEEYWMNKIADAMEPYLLSSGIEFVRNDPEQTVVNSIAQSNLAHYGMHVALHSNASPEDMSGLLRGSDVYYRPGDSQNALLSRRFAKIAAEELQNIDPIAQAIVRALTVYFGIPFAMPQPIRTGTVNTGGANLNIRSMPTTDSTIVAVAPNGSELTVYSQSGDWYAVRFQNATGYVYAPYLTVAS